MIYPTQSDDDLCALLEPVKKVAYQAGRKIMEIYDQGFEVEAKVDNTPLTEADLALFVYSMSKNTKPLHKRGPGLSKLNSRLKACK